MHNELQQRSWHQASIIPGTPFTGGGQSDPQGTFGKFTNFLISKVKVGLPNWERNRVVIKVPTNKSRGLGSQTRSRACEANQLFLAAASGKHFGQPYSVITFTSTALNLTKASESLHVAATP